MCGLIGFSGNADTYNWHKIAALMLINTERGRDACGYYYPVPNSNKYMLEKSDESFTKELIYAKTLQNKTSLFIGHDRQASSGFKNKDNAHPFIYNNQYQTVCAHNGTLTFLTDLLEMLRDTLPEHKDKFYSNEINVDSKVFSMYFSIKGIEDYKVLEYYEGAAALLFSNLDDPNVLYAYTDGTRPLHYGYFGHDMYISSEKEPLQFIGCKRIEHFKHDTVFKIENGKILKKTKITKKKIVKKHYHTDYDYEGTGSRNFNSFNNFTNAYGDRTSQNKNNYKLKDIRTLLNYAKTLDFDQIPIVDPRGMPNYKITKDYNLIETFSGVKGSKTRIQPLGDTFILRHWDKVSTTFKFDKNTKGIKIVKKYTIDKTVLNSKKENYIFEHFIVDLPKLEEMYTLDKTSPSLDDEYDEIKSDIINKLDELEDSLKDFENTAMLYLQDVEIEKEVDLYKMAIDKVKDELDEQDSFDYPLLESQHNSFCIMAKDKDFGYHALKDIYDIFENLKLLNSNYTIPND